ncbi:hypothetical protein [Chamaesiphon polymorphus]|uniref:Uncharacterized protein n=1 Tax=Chamaesiphon polymorphus CCALA 037 TaxID=2107692 RepID=A0A2T1GIB4_9CYAN|nr:hypothetical protein [Chamaesiphon polymorphus]PSB57489.1 hypothetical protein C7B77_08220 [Chamaesiphon polymorphus CCALA 037]
MIERCRSLDRDCGTNVSARSRSLAIRSIHRALDLTDCTLIDTAVDLLPQKISEGLVVQFWGALRS